MRVKICGITCEADAVAAAEAGADLLGFNFYVGSPRCVTVGRAAALVRAAKKVRPASVCVGVFVNALPLEVRVIVAACKLDAVQLAGLETVASFAELGVPVWPTVRAAAGVGELPPAAPQFVFDAAVAGEFGGTGKLADWTIAKLLAQKYQFLLAGGLTPENVAAAIAEVRPWGVDVASGVESAPGKKSAEKMRAFVAAAKTALVTHNS